MLNITVTNNGAILNVRYGIYWNNVRGNNH